MFKMQAKNNEYQKKNQRYVIDEKRRSLKKIALILLLTLMDLRKSMDM